MKAGRFTEEQIMGMLREQEAGAKMADLCCRHGVSSATFYTWKAKFGWFEVSEAKQMKGLESENARLKQLLADAMRNNAALKDLLVKHCEARCQARGCRPPSFCVCGERAAGVFGSWSGSDLGALPQQQAR